MISPTCISNGLEVLKWVSEVKNLTLPPVIIYTNKDTSNDEEIQLLKYSASVVIKGDGNTERLLDDVSLFYTILIHNYKKKITMLFNVCIIKMKC